MPKYPQPPPRLWGLWLDDGGPDGEGCWVRHTNGPRSGPMVFETERDAAIAAEYETREMDAATPIRPMPIGVEPGEVDRLARERDALIEACLDYWKYTVPDDPDSPEPFTLVECWINRLEGDDAGYISREAAVAAVRKAAGLRAGGI